MKPKTLPWVLIALLATLVGVYPIYYIIAAGSHPGLLQSKSPALLAHQVYLAAFYTHIIFGGIAILIGWIQFSQKLRLRNVRLHRTVGKIYVLSVALSSLAALSIAGWATGGWVSGLGFAMLAAVWLYTDFRAYFSIRRLAIDEHRDWMVRNYALTLAAVTLRIYLPLATAAMHIDFVPAYKVIAWMCWVPNMVVAEILVSRKMVR